MGNTTEALKLALEAQSYAAACLLNQLSTKDKHAYAVEKLSASTATIKEALAQTQEPVAWRAFDGEGGYDYRSYEDNESYADDWNKRNPNHKGWIEPLYTHAPQRTFVGLTDEEIEYVWRKVETSDFHDCVLLFAKELEAKLKEKNS